MNLWIWFQAISFQVIWLATVLGGNRWLWIPLCILLLHFTLSPRCRQDLQVLLLAFVGITTDIMLTQLGFFKFDEWPLWLLVLWFAFVLNFGHSLIFLRRLPLAWLALIGALGGCSAYLASWKLGAVEFPYDLWVTSGVLLAVWAMILPVLIKADFYLRKE